MSGKDLVAPTQVETEAVAGDARAGVGVPRVRNVPAPPSRRRSAPLPAHLARDALRRRMLAAADGLAVVVAAFAAEMGTPSAAEAFWTLSLLPVWLLLAKLHGLYDRDHRALRHLTVDELGSIVTWSTVSTAVVMALLAVTPSGALAAPEAIRLWVAVGVLSAAGRGLARVLWRAITPPSSVLLVGSGPLERATRRKLELFQDIHLEIAGTLDVDDVDAAERDDAFDLRVLAACPAEPPDRIIVCTQDVHEGLLADVMQYCRSRRVKLSVVPPLRGMFGTAVRLTHVAELPFVEYHTWDASMSTLTLKRCFDVTVALLVLILTAPLLAAAAVAIRLTSRGGVFYVQTRAGLQGNPFRMIKFRTMVADADASRCDVVELDALAHPMYKLRGDPRVTRVGRILRRWSLDELPQLVNVLKGEMSLVGPRPEEMALVQRYRPEHRFRLDVTPGMTGPMQVFGRGDLEFEERLAIEREYLENLSLGRDLRILLLTLPAVASGRGAF
jgi:exopolysaccharide biosynthesis polyprenyl glycosylphosphotransferase